ncbi:MAG TPA: preprotein translocase subunit SecY [Candidatus Pacearchaeota archaeon]|nr:preprotein translocase subunit SecY [Candidatus Parcubacteria bacterium]HNP79662.1 preprotein translocase subunit SecY [Candidatus Pacearchaeota archaeon]HOC53618.1 preprotein translocase subunit SecY [Candidatus Pacearchaeota archaeon]HQM24678.1 preprotein translocase subunit SecY [Candidatus Pacearchaeota archaeon]
MFNKLIGIIKAKDLRNKILFVLGVFLIFRIMANIPIPGIDILTIQEFFKRNEAFGLLNLFTGGALDSLSIAMLGLGPYITATIIFQLLTLIFPQIEKMYKEEGEQGRQRFNQYSRIASIPLAMIQGFAMLMFLKSQGAIGELSAPLMITSILAITAGSTILMWLGELISEKGIGNGVSLLIFAGIIADFPSNVGQMFNSFEGVQAFYYVAFFIISLIIIAGVVLINEGRRNIPVSYAKRVRGNKMYGGASTYLPLNINPAGVIPIIFAISILMIPSMIANFLKITWLGDLMQNPLVHGTLYFILVFIFTFFYTAVTFDPKNISSNLQKMGGFIPGIRPGQNTADYLKSILNKVLIIGATFLGLIAIMPSIIQAFTGIQQFSFLIGGTSLLIIVSVALETMKQINAQLEMREYDS